MRYALATAAGKDATLALHKARADGLDVPFAFCIYDPASERIRFHGTRKALVEAQAEALGLQLLALPAAPDQFEPVFMDALARLKSMGAGASCSATSIWRTCARGTRSAPSVKASSTWSRSGVSALASWCARSSRSGTARTS